MKRKVLVLLMLLLFSVTVTQSATIAGAAIQGWVLDAPNRSMNVRIVNTSEKAITAFVLDTFVTDSIGTQESRLLWDFLNNQTFIERYRGTPVEERLRAHLGLDTIPVGGSYDQIVAVPKDFKDFTATLTVVAYADKTAEATSQSELDWLIEMRTATAAALSKAIDIINASKTRNEAATGVQKYYEVYNATVRPTTEVNTATLDNIVHDLMQSPDEKLETYVAVKEKERAVWSDQAKLKLVGGAQ